MKVFVVLATLVVVASSQYVFRPNSIFGLIAARFHTDIQTKEPRLESRISSDMLINKNAHNVVGKSCNCP